MQYERLMKTLSLQKPITDPKNYSLLRTPNGLKVLLVQDTAAQLSFAAMDVNAGSWQEPSSISGLAHFLEHMEFIGSKSFNNNNNNNSNNETSSFFDKFLADNGGFSNAYTTDVHTNYFFHVNTKAFKQSLKMFAHMFIDPLFRADSVEKEAHAVESEYEIDINKDDWIFLNLVSLLCRPDHPMSRFVIGTTNTLLEAPKKQGLDIVAELQRFHDQHYSANVMGLVLYSSSSLEEMEDFLKKCDFYAIPNRNVSKPDFTAQGKPIAVENLGSLIKLKTNSGARTLDVIV